MALYVFEEEGGAAGFWSVPRPSLAARSAISAISRSGETSAVMRLSSPDFSSVLIQSRRSV